MSNCPHCWDEDILCRPTPSDKVHKDECMYCHNTAFHDAGIFTCTCCFQGFCLDHVSKHIALNVSHNLFFRFHKTPAPKQEITSLKDVGLLPAPTVDCKLYCADCKEEMDVDSGDAAQCYQAINGATSFNNQASIDASKSMGDGWPTAKPCKHCTGFKQVEELKFGPGNPPSDSSTCSFEGCGCTKNNWLCATCGAVGCPRKEAGGNMHAISHFLNTGHPLVIKLGTVTSQGADVHCYACDDEVILPNINEVMAKFGVNTETAVKTTKSLAEMELDNSLKHDYGKITEAGKELVKATGQGHVGLHNFGNTCYMNSVLQVLFNIPQFVDRYAARGHIKDCTNKDPLSCFQCQMEKLFVDVNRERFASYSEEDDHLNGITPRHFKSLVTKGHADFSTAQQQDAAHFMSYLLSFMAKQDNKSELPFPGRFFDFQMRSRKNCTSCNGNKYKTELASMLNLAIPVDPVSPPLDDKGQPKQLTEEEMDAIRPKTSLDACLKKYLEAEAIECTCDGCKNRSIVLSTNGMATFPDFLAIHLQREYFDRTTFTPKKLEVYVDVPEQLDLSSVAAPKREAGEQVISDETVGASTQSKTSDIQPDEMAITQLLSMGIEMEPAVWALKNTNNNVERAIDFVFSHPEGPPKEDPVAAADAAKRAAESAKPISDGPPTYELMGMISHIGHSAISGHYIAHVKKNGKWIIFNDEKVSFSQEPPFRMASVYVYKRHQ